MGELIVMAVKNRASFGRRLAELRKARGLTQTELGERIGVSKRVIAYYEGETDRPPAAKLDQLAAALGVTTDELLGVKPVKEKPPVKNRRLIKSLQILEKLPKEDQKAVVNYIDALSAKRGVKR
jgi:transcriptional regulator with XRE-family HTH domain